MRLEKLALRATQRYQSDVESATALSDILRVAVLYGFWFRVRGGGGVGLGVPAGPGCRPARSRKKTPSRSKGPGLYVCLGKKNRTQV